MSQKNRPSLSHAIATQGEQLDIEDAIARAKGKTGQQRFADQISAYAAKQRAKSQRRNAKLETGPTPERLAKLAEPDDVREHEPPIRETNTARALTRAHTIVAPIDKYGQSWPEDMERAARDLRNIFLIAESGYQRVTGSYDGMPGGVAGPRSGGVQDHIRECAAMAKVIEEEFPTCMREIHWFLTQTVVKNGTGDAMKFEDAGALISPWKSEEAKKGVGYGLFYRTIQVLAPFLAKQRALGFGRGVSTPEAARALNTQMRALAQVLREKEARKAKREEEGR